MAPLGTPPDWSNLSVWDTTISRSTFEHLLFNVYAAKGDRWKKWIHITPKYVAITRQSARPKDPPFILHFRKTDAEKPPRFWRSLSELPAPTSPARPLQGLRIALDPGHLGGPWAQLEKRHFQIGKEKPVCEGDLTLNVAKRLRTRLEKLGATVFLVRKNSIPATPLRPPQLTNYARALYREKNILAPPFAGLELSRNRLFAVSAEIRARAAHINTRLKPDLVFCLHFNAEGWGDPENPKWAKKNHLHALVHGNLLPAEAAHDDERFETLRRLLQRTHAEESALASEIMTSFAKASDLPPYTYKGKNARRVNSSRYVWARNLLANRLYQCPVIFLEPYVMNHTSSYRRIQAGAYSGKKKIDDKLRTNIFDEYADAVADGTARWARKNRS